MFDFVEEDLELNLGDLSGTCEIGLHNEFCRHKSVQLKISLDPSFKALKVLERRLGSVRGLSSRVELPLRVSFQGELEGSPAPFWAKIRAVKSGAGIKYYWTPNPQKE